MKQHQPCFLLASVAAWLLLASVGCGGSPLASSGAPGQGSGGSGVSSGRVPQDHRPAGSICPATRGPAFICHAGPPDRRDECQTDSDCKAGPNGRCVSPNGPIGGCSPTTCSYDECQSDADCPTAVPCECRSSGTDGAANRCAPPGTCAVDADCGPGGYCSPGSYRSNCEGLIYFCHGAKDTCTNDIDCPDTASGVAQTCNYDQQRGHFACGLRCFTK